MGIGKAFRPLVRAAEGYGIGEVDLEQIEVGLAAAVFRDEAMIADFNVGDVYVAMARRIFAGQIDPGDAGLGERAFQDKYPELRRRAKPLVLGIIYGKTIPGIALDLGIKLPEARALWDAFRRLYPTVCEGMERARVQSIRRGYAYISGLRRFRAGAGTATPHEERGMGNAYVQGTAALVFFDAGNRLRRLYRQHHARLIIPVHDAFVFEAPIGRVADVAELTRSVLIRTVQEWFPELQPRAKVNIAHADVLEPRGAPRQRRAVRRGPDAGAVTRPRGRAAGTSKESRGAATEPWKERSSQGRFAAPRPARLRNGVERYRPGRRGLGGLRRRAPAGQGCRRAPPRRPSSGGAGPDRRRPRSAAQSVLPMTTEDWRCDPAARAGDRGGRGDRPGGAANEPWKERSFQGRFAAPPPGRDPESGDRSRLLGIDPPTTTEVLGDGVSSRVGGSMWTGSSMLSGPASWRWPDDAPRGQAWRVWRGHRIDPADILERPAGLPVGAGRQPGPVAPGRGARERRPRPRRADGPAQARRPEPRARDIDLG